MTADDLRALAFAHSGPGCPACAALRCEGWESMPGDFDRAQLRRVASLRPQGDDTAEPTLAEYHPAGTNAWSADAPIALGWYPYHRCELWQCAACARPFLRYTEYGGYYNDERIRELRAGLVVDAPPPPAY